jgi:hypothetical protein
VGNRAGLPGQAPVCGLPLPGGYASGQARHGRAVSVSWQLASRALGWLTPGTERSLLPAARPPAGLPGRLPACLQIEIEKKLRGLLTKDKEKAEEEAALAMGLCMGGSMLP